MSVDEKLGISVQFDLSQLDNQLAQIKSKLQNTFGDLSKLVNVAGLEKEFQGSTRFFQEYSNQLGRTFTGSKEEIKALKEEIRNLNNEIKARQKATKLLQLDGDITELEKFKAKLKEVQDKLNISTAAFNFNPQNTKWSNDIATQSAQAETWLKNLGKQGFKYLNGEIVETSKHLSKFSGGILNLLGLEARFYGVRTVLFALSSQFKEAVTGALDFNQAMHDIAAIAGSSPREMKEIGEAILDIARNSKFSTKEVSELMQVLAQAGVMAKDLPAVSDTVGKFATGVGGDAKVSADIFTTAMNVWEVSADRSTQIANTLTAGLNNSKLEVAGLATAFNYLAPQAATFGYTLEETVGIVANMAQAGVKASTIGTGVSQLLKELAAPKDRLVALLEHYGIALDAVNPKLHTFGEIVEAFKEKGVATEHVLQALDSRVGRSLVAAMKLGGASFEDMTNSVTGTNASLVAYSKNMEGVRSRLNVIKQEFLTAIVAAGDTMSVVFNPILTMFGSIVKGMNTAWGAVFAGVSVLGILGGAVTLLTPQIVALSLAMYANPLFGSVALIVGGITAVAGALAIFGSSQSDVLSKTEAYTKESIKQGEVLQKVGDAFKKVHTEIKNQNKETKEALELYDKDANDKSPKVVKMLESKIKLTDDMKKALNNLKLDYPKYFENLDLEHGKNKDLLEVLKKVNAERKIKDINDINTYNKTVNDIKDIDDKIKGIKDKQGSNANGVISSPLTNLIDNRRIKSLEDDKNKLLKLKKDLYAGIGIKTVINGEQLQPDDSPEVKEKTSVKPLNLKKGKTDAEKQEDVNEIVTNYLEEQKALRAKLSAERKKIEVQLIEDELRDKNLSEKERNDKKLVAIKAIDEEFAEKREQLRIKTYVDVAKKLGGKFKDEGDGIITFDKKFSKDQAQTMINSAAETLKVQYAELNDELGKAEVKVNNLAKPKAQLTSDYYVKQIDKRMQQEAATYKVMKDQAKSAEEVRNIEIDMLKTQIQGNKEKVKAYQHDLDELRINESILEAKEKAGETLSKDEERYVNIKKNLEAINEQTDEYNLKLAQQQDTSFLGNFKRGVYSAQKGFGTDEQRTQELGKSIVTNVADSTTNAIDSMVTALERGEFAWKNFRQTVGDILIDVAKEIQKFMIRKAVISFIEYVVGSFGSSTVNAPNNSAGVGQGGSEPGSAFASTGGLITSKGVARFDLGGLAKGGIKGKDSIPALIQDGEYVVKPSAVARYGVDFLQALNQEKLQTYSTGGMAGFAAKATSGSTGEGQPFVLNIINVADPSSVPKMTGTEVINTVSFNLGKKDVLYKQIKGILQGN